MFTHVFVLGISFFAIGVSSRPAYINKTISYFRVEVLVAFINALLLLGITGLSLARSSFREQKKAHQSYPQKYTDKLYCRFKKIALFFSALE
ncbi:MAG: hypothetical protein ACOC7U_04085 [Spirochaetota bacterium]